MLVTGIIIVVVIFLLLAFVHWEIDRLRRTQRLLARRILAIDAPELAGKLAAPNETPLGREDLVKMLPLLRQRLPELKPTNNMLRFLEKRGLTFKEIHATIDILHEEGKANRPGN
jgi:hypothetical protein